MIRQQTRIEIKRFYDGLPRKRMGAGALFFNQRGELLLLKTSYKEDWTIPGGIVERDESLRRACEREVREETGLHVRITELLCMDYRSRQGVKTESLQFLFRGGTLRPAQERAIRIDGHEIVEFGFFPAPEALRLLNPTVSARVRCLLPVFRRGEFLYLENTQPVRRA